MVRSGIEAVLFDLDGTLIDSAPDLATAANRLREDHGMAALADAHYRPHCGSGARGMIFAGFGCLPEDPRYPVLRDAFYGHFERCVVDRTSAFGGVEALLARLEFRALRWGIVTNKAMRFALPGIRVSGLDRAGLTVVAGDSTPHTKPHPAPLLEAARRLGVAPRRCVYVGDDLRDIQAARAAGMAAVAAAWGYLGLDSTPHDWCADAVLQAPGELLQWLFLA